MNLDGICDTPLEKDNTLSGVESSLFPVAPTSGSQELKTIQKTKKEKYEDYEGFIEKFIPKKTTDDCYTPPAVYEAVLGWLLKQKPEIRGRKIVRPFWPGNDYEHFDYPEECVVVDNPPFSILSQIRHFFLWYDIPYLLFAPQLTVFSSAICDTVIVADADIVYENGAKVKTAFVSNLFPETVAMTAPVLGYAINDVLRSNRKDYKRARYEYPHEVLTVSRLAHIAKGGMEFTIRNNECERISALDEQKHLGKSIFGSGLLISKQKAEEVRRKEEESREKVVVWKLSHFEQLRVERLSKQRDSL